MENGANTGKFPNCISCILRSEDTETNFVQLRLHHAQLHTVIIQHNLFFKICFGHLSDLHFFGSLA